MKNNRQLLEYAIVGVIILTVVLVFWQVKNKDINFCRKVFYGMMRGDSKVENYVDWENFQAVGVDVGAAYRQLPDEKEKLAYRASFFKGFPAGFRKFSGKPEAFVNWRDYGVKDGKKIVAVDYIYGKTLLFSISRLKGVKLYSIQWE